MQILGSEHAENVYIQGSVTRDASLFRAHFLNDAFLAHLSLITAFVQFLSIADRLVFGAKAH
jgi:hypothetical protein